MNGVDIPKTVMTTRVPVVLKNTTQHHLDFTKKPNLYNCLFFIFQRPLSSHIYSTLYDILSTNPLLDKNRCAESAPA